MNGSNLIVIVIMYKEMVINCIEIYFMLTLQTKSIRIIFDKLNFPNVSLCFMDKIVGKNVKSSISIRSENIRELLYSLYNALDHFLRCFKISKPQF